MEEAGYVPETKTTVHDADENLSLLCHHTEKLAIAFGLLMTPPGQALLIVKNRRTCQDCHTTAKFISKLVEREINLRDSIRFHSFKEGYCSCGDYW